MILVDQIKNLDFFCLWQLFRPSIKFLLHPSERLRIRAKNVIAPPCLKYALHNQSHLFKLSKVSNKRTAQCSKSRKKVGQKFLQILSKTTWISNKLAILASFLNICDQCDLIVKAGKIDSVSYKANSLVKMKF